MWKQRESIANICFNLIFVFESEEGDRFGYFMNTKMTQIGKYVEDKNGFLFIMKEDMIKLDFNSGNKPGDNAILVHYPQKEELITIANNNIIIMKGKNKQSKCKSLSKFDCEKDFKLLSHNRQTFTLKRIVVLQCKESEEMSEIKKYKRKEQLEMERATLKDKSEKAIKMGIRMSITFLVAEILLIGLVLLIANFK